VLELGERGTPVLGTELRELRAGPRAAVLVDCDPARDRECPRAKVLAVTELWIGAQRTQERLLERVLGAVASELPDEEGVDLLAVLLVETFERRQAHVTIF
jgi:hypothetical protein